PPEGRNAMLGWLGHGRRSIATLFPASIAKTHRIRNRILKLRRPLSVWGTNADGSRTQLRVTRQRVARVSVQVAHADGISRRARRPWPALATRAQRHCRLAGRAELSSHP